MESGKRLVRVIFAYGISVPVENFYLIVEIPWIAVVRGFRVLVEMSYINVSVCRFGLQSSEFGLGVNSERGLFGVLKSWKVTIDKIMARDFMIFDGHNVKVAPVIAAVHELLAVDGKAGIAAIGDLLEGGNPFISVFRPEIQRDGFVPVKVYEGDDFIIVRPASGHDEFSVARPDELVGEEVRTKS